MGLNRDDIEMKVKNLANLGRRTHLIDTKT